MKILAIETSTEACSAALLISDNEIFTRIQLAPREHTKLILPMLDDVLDEAGVLLKDVDAIAFGRGPGAFTGLRIAAGVAQGVALSVDKPVIPVSTLAALAFQATKNNYQGEPIIAALDARMNEIYWGNFQFDNKELKLVGKERVGSAKELLAGISSDAHIGIGNAWGIYQEELFSEKRNDNLRIIKGELPSAENIARLALPLLKDNKTVTVENAQPVYIRNKVAEKSKKQV